MKNHWYILLLAVLIFSCKSENRKYQDSLINEPFNSKAFTVKNTENSNKAKGQIVYLPVYSNMPYSNGEKKYDLSGVLTIHNVDLSDTITVTQVLYYHNDGYLVKRYISNPLLIKPFEAKHFFVPEYDKSGAGAHFAVEWKSKKLVNTPLIEVLMMSLTDSQGITFTSQGKVIAEEK